MENEIDGEKKGETKPEVRSVESFAQAALIGAKTGLNSAIVNERLQRRRVEITSGPNQDMQLKLGEYQDQIVQYKLAIEVMEEIIIEEQKKAAEQTF